MNIQELVGFNLRRVRLKMGLTQEELAGDKSEGAKISRIESGRENTTIRVLARLAKKLEVDVIEFFRPVKAGAALPPNLRAGRKPKKS